METRAGRGLRHTTTPDGSQRTIELDPVQMAVFLPPVGAVFPFAGNVAPAGYLLCDSSAVSRTTYAKLFALIGTTYGVGDGSTTFNLPDLRGRVPFGQNAATFATLGGTGGEETHVLSSGEMPSHTHTGPAHTHDVTVGNGSGGANDRVSHGTTFTSTGTVSAAANSAGTGATGSTGSGTAHNTLPPYQVLIYVIKY